MEGDLSGVLVGVVIDRDDPDGQGRIRVRYPDFPGLLESDWIPISSPMAGKGRGFRFCPELEDECLISFRRGDADHPFVVGFLHNGVDTPPSDDVHRRVIASVNGHSITFYDPTPANGNRGRLLIEDGHGTQIELTNGHTRITAVGQLDLSAQVLTLNGRPVVPGGGTI
jgi:phage baseplate assembly protein V